MFVRETIWYGPTIVNHFQTEKLLFKKKYVWLFSITALQCQTWENARNDEREQASSRLIVFWWIFGLHQVPHSSRLLYWHWQTPWYNSCCNYLPAKKEKQAERGREERRNHPLSLNHPLDLQMPLLLLNRKEREIIRRRKELEMKEEGWNFFWFFILFL